MSMTSGSDSAKPFIERPVVYWTLNGVFVLGMVFAIHDIATRKGLSGVPYLGVTLYLLGQHQPATSGRRPWASAAMIVGAVLMIGGWILVWLA